MQLHPVHGAKWLDNSTRRVLISGHSTNDGVVRTLKMRSSQLLFLVILQSQMLISVSGQTSIGCFVQGECIGSLNVGGASSPQGELQCLEYCTTVEGSKYFSYDPQNPVSMVDHVFGDKSIQFLTCSIACASQIVRTWVLHNAPIAPLVTCLVSVLSAMLGEYLDVVLQLMIEVLCPTRIIGLFLYLDVATDAYECAEECNALEACKWFTYDTEGQACVLSEDRESLSFCDTCTYGHHGCTQEESFGMILHGWNYVLALQKVTLLLLLLLFFIIFYLAYFCLFERTD